MLAFARRLAVASLCLALTLAMAGPAALPAQATDVETRYAAIVVDAGSGEVLYARHADATRFPASITKVMTIYLAMEALAEGRIRETDLITISPRAAAQPPSKLGLPAGRTITVDNAIRALAVRSANDIAVALAEHIGGSEANFAEMMTAKARELGMTETRYFNPHGLPDGRQTTTARDISILCRAVMRDFPQYYGYFGQRQWSFEGRSYNNTNGLLHSMPGVDGIKTGFTNASGYNLAASAVEDGRRLITVVLGGRSSATRNAHVAQLMTTGFEVGRLLDAGQRLEVAQALFNPPAPEPVETITLASAPMDPADVTATLNGSLGGAEADAAPRPRTERPSSPPARRDSEDTWVVQVGAFRERNVASNWLSEVGRRFREHFRNAEGAVSDAANGWYRARYSGLSREAAEAACAAMTERRVSCMVLRGS